MRTVECPVWCVAITSSLYEWFCLSDVVLMAVDLWRASHGQGAGGIRVEMAMRAEDMYMLWMLHVNVGRGVSRIRLATTKAGREARKSL